MENNTLFALLAIGLAAGLLSGLVGIGGGIIIVPVLVYMGFSQHLAQGTVLFMFLLPIGILGVYNYYSKGFVDFKTAFIIATTFFVGSYFGSKLAINIDQTLLKKIFGAIIILLGIKLILGK
jgi:uncharacterized membrane protein YfcA